MMTKVARMMMNKFEMEYYRKGYIRQKYGALVERGISFDLSFEDWLRIWIDSGKLAQRGRYRGQYVMARIGDKGPYAIGNVKIITCSENAKEAATGRKKSPETLEKLRKASTGRIFTEEAKRKISAARKGKPLSEAHKNAILTALLGRKHTPEELEKMSRSQKGRKLSAEHKAKLAAAQLVRRTRENIIKKMPWTTRMLD